MYDIADRYFGLSPKEKRLTDAVENLIEKYVENGGGLDLFAKMFNLVILTSADLFPKIGLKERERICSNTYNYVMARFAAEFPNHGAC